MKAVSTGNNLVANTTTTIFTVPKGYYAKCILLHTCNTSPSKHISFNWYKASTATNINIVAEQVLSARTTLDLLTNSQCFVLEEDDYVTAFSEAGATMSVITTFELYRKGE
jgi:hypothetical protein